MSDLNTFWNWNGQYVGYRISDGLFGDDGHQLGYFAEGDEVYACNGDYIGEIRGTNRLITNLSKKAWRRRTLIPSLMRSSPGHHHVTAKDMLPGFEDFPAPPDRA